MNLHNKRHRRSSVSRIKKQRTGEAVNGARGNPAATILGIGKATPEYSIDQSHAAQLAQQLGVSQRWHDALPKLYQKSGVQRRYSVLLERLSENPQERQSFYSVASKEQPKGPSTEQRMKAYAHFAGPLLLKACERSLSASGIDKGDITHLVTVSCTGFFSPGMDHCVIDRLALNRSVQRVHVGFMGCHGLINGLRVAQSFVESNPNAVVLVGAVELCSLHQQYSEDPQQLVANSLFADGAASVVVGTHNDTRMIATPWTIASSFSWMLEDTASFMAWSIGNHGFEMQLSPEVPRIIETNLRAPLEAWLAHESIALNDALGWAIHPGGPRILDSVERAFGLNPDQMANSRVVLSNYGNMSSPTVLFILDQMNGDTKPITQCVLIAFGPGLHCEAMLLSR